MMPRSHYRSFFESLGHHAADTSWLFVIWSGVLRSVGSSDYTTGRRQEYLCSTIGRRGWLRYLVSKQHLVSKTQQRSDTEMQCEQRKRGGWGISFILHWGGHTRVCLSPRWFMGRGCVPDVELLSGLIDSLLAVHLCRKKVRYIKLRWTTLRLEPLLPCHYVMVELMGHIVKRQLLLSLFS